MEGYLLGVDIGTYSSKGVLARPNGEVVASHTVPHTMDMPRPGHFEQDADAVWWHDFVLITKELLARSGIDPGSILGIGTSAIGSCVLPIDDHGRPLRPGILYGIDTRASAEIEFLNEKIGAEEIFARGGAYLTSQASGPKVLWIRNHEPEVYEKTRWFLTSQAYLVYRLTGKASIDVYTAAGYIPLFDVHRREWIPDYAEYIAPLDRFPPTYWSHEVVGGVTPEAAAETGLAAGTPVVAGTTDAAAEALSASVAEFNDMMLMFGSSIFFIMKTADLVPTRRFWSSNFLEQGTYAFLGGMSTAGSLTTWFRDTLGQLELQEEAEHGKNAFELLAAQAHESTIGSNGLICLPYFEGERTPIHDADALGAWFGLRLKHTKGDLYRSIMEGVAYGIRHNLEAMQEEGLSPSRILAVGGGTKNPLWLRIVADCCQIALHVPEQQIGASYGDAFLAGMGVGLFEKLSDVQQWVKIRERVDPDPRVAGDYAFYYRCFRDLYEQTKETMHQIARREKGKAD